MDKILFNPPVTFSIVLIFVIVLSKLLSGLAFKNKKRPTSGSRESYACGEDVKDHLAQPDYSEFFPFAFFFTIAHVATLILTTVPMQTFSTFAMAMVYLTVVVIGLLILFRR
jgi:NADH-quinone oxidoreductase subunit A